MSSSNYVIATGIFIAACTALSAQAQDAPDINKKPPHTARFMWQGLDWITVSDASIISWVSENCSEKIADDQVKKANIILKATDTHPMAENARTWVLNGIRDKYKGDACTQLTEILAQKEPL